MSVTNPPPIRVPQEFAKDRVTFAYFNELHMFLRLLWERTGGGTDAIEVAGDAGDSMVSTYSHAARIAALGLDVDSAERASILGLPSLADKAAIAALQTETRNATLPIFTPDAARYGELSARVAASEDDIEDLAADVAAVTAGDPLLAYTALPLLARVGAFDERITATESDIADLESDVAAITAGDPILAYSSLPDKAAISALRDDVTAVDRAMVALQPLHAKLAADSTRLDAHEALNEAYFAYFEILLTAIADVANTQFMLAGPPLAGRVAAVSEQATATNILAFPGPDAARYAALVEQLKDEVQNLRIEIAALYSDRAKLAHLDNRVNDMEIVSWL